MNTRTLRKAALYVALVSLVMRQRPRADTAIVGVVDNLTDFYSPSHYTEAVIHACQVAIGASAISFIVAGMPP